MKVGLIGLGQMGMPMCLNLIRDGFDVYVFDVLNELVDVAIEEGAYGCSSSGQLAANVDVLIFSLPNSKIVESVVFGKDGVLDNCNMGTVIIDMSTVSPSCTKAIAKKVADKGIRYCDAPVSGGVSGAEAGTLTIMVGADNETFSIVKPIFESLGKNIYHIGEIGGGDAMKMVNNLLLGCNMVALAEALVLGLKCGLSVETMQKVISVSSGRSYVLEAKLEKFIMQDKFEGGFAVDLLYKDLGLALDESRDEKVPLPMTAIAVQMYEVARSMGQGREDMSSIVKVYEQLAGTRIRGSGE